MVLQRELKLKRDDDDGVVNGDVVSVIMVALKDVFCEGRWDERMSLYFIHFFVWNPGFPLAPHANVSNENGHWNLDIRHFTLVMIRDFIEYIINLCCVSCGKSLVQGNLFLPYKSVRRTKINQIFIYKGNTTFGKAPFKHISGLGYFFACIMQTMNKW